MGTRVRLVYLLYTYTEDRTPNTNFCTFLYNRIYRGNLFYVSVFVSI